MWLLYRVNKGAHMCLFLQLHKLKTDKHFWFEDENKERTVILQENEYYFSVLCVCDICTQRCKIG